MPATLQQDLAKSAGEDSLGWLVNLGWAHVFPPLHAISIPTTLMLELGRHAWRRINRRSPRNYTAWKACLEDVPALYRSDWPHAVTIFYEGIERPLPQQLLVGVDATPRQLHLRLNAEPFRLSEAVRELSQQPRERLIAYLRRRNAYFRKTRKENMCLCVRDCLVAPGSVTLEVSPLAYDDVLATHYVLDVDWMGHSSLRSFLLSRHPASLGPLRDSLVPNILGIDTLLFTPSGSLILQKRSRKVAVRPGEICASSSGGASPDDIERFGRLAILREGAEELAIDPAKVVPGSTRFLGLARDFASHGVVESYFCADTLESDAEILARARTAPDRQEHSSVFIFHFGDELVRGSLRNNPVLRTRFDRRMDELIRKYRRQLSSPFLSALALWQRMRLLE